MRARAGKTTGGFGILNLKLGVVLRALLSALFTLSIDGESALGSEAAFGAAVSKCSRLACSERGGSTPKGIPWKSWNRQHVVLRVPEASDSPPGDKIKLFQCVQ